MTAVSYPDLSTSSPRGQYRVEAKSPDNRTINQRNGLPPDPTRFAYEYGQEQSDFRYQLIDSRNSEILWERWQEGDEPSPWALYVSDDGWVVIQTHGYVYARLIAVSQDGKDALSVGIGPCAHPSKLSVDEYIHDDQVHISTAGLMWHVGATQHFFKHNAASYFCFVTGWGRRILFDLEKNQLVNSGQLDPAVENACRHSEWGLAVPKLTAAAGELKDHDSLGVLGGSATKRSSVWSWSEVEGLISLALRNEFSETLPSLMALEERSITAWSTGCHSLPGDYSVFAFAMRPLLQLAIRFLGGRPAGYACYGFTQEKFKRRSGRHERTVLLNVPERLLNRDDLVTKINQDMNASQVLEFIGAPDYLESFSERCGKSYIWGEHWYYYLGSSTGLANLHITWRAGSDGDSATALSINSLSRDYVFKRIYEIIGL